jgi:hypothetical protein
MEVNLGLFFPSFYGLGANKLTNSLKAPGTPAGSSLKNTSEV